MQRDWDSTTGKPALCLPLRLGGPKHSPLVSIAFGYVWVIRRCLGNTDRTAYSDHKGTLRLRLMKRPFFYNVINLSQGYECRSCAHNMYVDNPHLLTITTTYLNTSGNSMSI